MLPNITKGTGISGSVRYALGQGKGRGNDLKEGQESRVEWLSGQGFGFEIESREDADLARRMMEFAAANQTSPTRKCEKDAFHLSLSWHPDEQPTRAQMEEAARGALKALGMENARALFVAHNDTEHKHMHIVASRIDPETGRAFRDYNDIKKVNQWALDYEREHGRVMCVRREAVDARNPEKALEALTANSSTFERRDLERLLGKGIVSREDRSKLADEILARPDVIGLRENADAKVTRYTTRDVLAAERQVTKDAAALAGDLSHGLPDGYKDAALAKHSNLSAEQRAAFQHATGSEGLAMIAGEAGTGKSTTMAAVRDAYEAAGSKVIGMSGTNAVVQDMRKDGFTANTIAAELKRQEMGGTAWDNRTVLVVDEAAMVSTKNLGAVMERAREAGAKLILVGDAQQLGSIERGGMFGALQQAHGAAELREIHRVGDVDQKRAFNLMHEGQFKPALEVFEQRGDIHWSKTQDDARTALVGQWAQDSAANPDKTRFVFAYTNAAVDTLNQDIRAIRRERGELGPDHSLRTKDGPVNFAEGDRIQFTGNAANKVAKDAGLANGNVGTVQNIDGQRVTVALDAKKGEEPRTITFTVGADGRAGEFDSFRHGYAGTIYKGQGRTLDETYLYHSEHWRSSSSYVALTRHRDSASVFAATDTTKDLDQLARQMARVDDRRAASQFHRDALLPEERTAQTSAGFARTAQDVTGQTPVPSRPQEATRAAEPAKTQTASPAPRPNLTSRPQAAPAVPVGKAADKGFTVASRIFGGAASSLMDFAGGVLDFLSGSSKPSRITAAEYASTDSAEVRRAFREQQAADKAAELARSQALDQIRDDIRENRSFEPATIRSLSQHDLINIRSRGDAGLLAILDEQEKQKQRDSAGHERERER